MAIDLENRIRNVTAVLGPTNTGKTHLAIERMLGHETGMIGLPLRLLAREVYDRIVLRVGAAKVGLITGEEKIKPDNARYWVCTVEAMPRDVTVDFLAIDEVQLAADPERGHVFTDRLLNARGRLETLMLGAGTMRDAISDLIPGANFISRPRLSRLTYAGQKKITRLPQRTAVVTFSASEVYGIAELIRRQRGGAAVVLGALSPRTRNAQVALYQSGDVDYLVATDAVGMGLNLDVDHVAFAAVRKFDGQTFRNLTPSELAQVAGRAGRHMNDGSFFVTADVDPFEADLVERLENHTFDPVKVLQWRNRRLDFSSLNGLIESLRALPGEQRLVRARTAEDVMALETLASDAEVRERARTPQAVSLLWDVCQVPDYRKVSSSSHAELVSTLFRDLTTGEGHINEDWFARQVELANRTDGDIDTLSTRIAHVRTWTFVSNRPSWLRDPEHWQGKTREIEDNLSDAMHEQLTQRFVDRRTSALVRGMRDKEELTADIAADGRVEVENHYVGRLQGFCFSPDTQADGVHGKAARNAAAQVLAKELAMRVRRVTSAKNDAFKLNRQARIIWRGEEIGRLEPGEHVLKPLVSVICDEHLPPADRDKVQERLATWTKDQIGEKLKPLVEIAAAEDVAGLAKGIAFQLTETLGALKREAIADDVKSLDQAARAQLRKYGVRFGAFNIFFPLLLKPAPAELTLTLWALKHAAATGLDAKALPEPPRAGLTSVAADAAIPEAFYRACGYHLCGPRAVRIDILERLADLIRQLLSWKPGADAKPQPRGATGSGGFTVVPEMMSILGCSPDELGAVLQTLGFRMEKRPAPKPVKDAPTLALEAAVALARAMVAPPAPAPEPAAQVTAGEGATAGEGVTEGEGVAEGGASEGGEGKAGETKAGETKVGEEQQFIEVWRPKRREREGQYGGQGRRPWRGRDGDGAGQNQARDGQSREGDRGRGPRRFDDRRRGPAGAPMGGPGADAAAAAPGGADPSTLAAGDAATATPGGEARRDGGRDGWRGNDRRGGNRDNRPREGQREGGSREGDRAATANRPAHPRAGAAQRPGGNRGDNRGDRSQDQRPPRDGHRRGGPPGGRDRDGPRRDEARAPVNQYRSAAPQRGGTVDPDSPFAKLGALKQLLEKQGRDPS